MSSFVTTTTKIKKRIRTIELKGEGNRDNIEFVLKFKVMALYNFQLKRKSIGTLKYEEEENAGNTEVMRSSAVFKRKKKILQHLNAAECLIC